MSGVSAVDWQKTRMKDETYRSFATHFFFDCQCVSPGTLNPDGTKLTTSRPTGFSATRLLDPAIAERMLDIHLSCIIGGAAKGASETISGVSVRNDDLICVSLTLCSVLIHIYLS